MMQLDDLKAAPYNPRTITPANARALQFSLAEFGDISGIVWNRRTGFLVCGHQRLAALKAQYSDLRIDEDERLASARLISLADNVSFPVRVVDWPVEKEKAANVAANSSLLAGEFTPALEDLITEIEAVTPDQHDALRLHGLLASIEFPEVERSAESAEVETIPQMELLPFEHYDYVLVLARTTQDWEFLCERLGLQKVDAQQVAGARKKIGLGRAIDAQKLIALLEARA